MYEKISGYSLHLIWSNLEYTELELAKLIVSLVQSLSNLRTVRFSHLGSIYYKEDVPSHLQDRPLFDPEFTVSTANSERF